MVGLAIKACELPRRLERVEMRTRTDNSRTWRLSAHGVKLMTPVRPRIDKAFSWEKSNGHMGPFSQAPKPSVETRSDSTWIAGERHCGMEWKASLFSGRQCRSRCCILEEHRSQICRKSAASAKLHPILMSRRVGRLRSCCSARADCGDNLNI